MKPIYSGKIRELYDISEQHLIIVTTDRISAFDHILPVMIQNKGVILNRLSNFWFEKTKDIITGHIIDDDTRNMPDYFRNKAFKDRTVMVQKLNMLPFEFVVRGYLFGNMWKAYENGELFCGNILNGTYKLAQKLEYPILTPAIKHKSGHDEYVSLQQIETQLGTKMTKQITEICFNLYDRCSTYALSKGLIIADAKFEFGLNKQEELVLGDEIFTPDSSRFWDIADYKIGTSPKSFDKQLLRDWLLNHKINDQFQFENIPQNIVTQTEQIYRECFSRLVS